MSSDEVGGFKFTGKARREPNADIRQVGVTLHEFYTGCVGAGFDKKQALVLTVTFLQETLRHGMETGGDDA